MIPSLFNRLDYPSLGQSVYLNQASVRKEEPVKPNLFIIGGKRMVPAVGLEPTT
jgi:hypothetical protein